MSGPGDSAGAVDEGEGVLANLPRTRPQRASPRRAAARRADAGAQTARSEPAAVQQTAQRPARKPAARAAAKTAKPRRPETQPSPGRPRARSAPRGGPQVGGEPVPRQGFASEGERVSGPVSPPGGAELLATAAEIVSELAKAGVSTGERLLRDVFSHLPLS